MEIRKAKEEEIEEITKKLWKPIMEYHEKIDEKFKSCDDAISIFRRYVKECIEESDRLVLVAEEGKDLIGYLIASLEERSPIYIEKKVGMINDLYVKEKFRERGIGSKLFNRAEKWLKDFDIKYIKIKVAVKNKLAQSFWNEKEFENLNHVKFKEV